jgi:hypothetical protein
VCSEADLGVHVGEPGEQGDVELLFESEYLVPVFGGQLHNKGDGVVGV